MKNKKHLYFLIKLIQKGQKALGRGGTSYPGNFALKRDPQILQAFSLPEQRVFVSGTNGKTTTANALARVLEASGQKVGHNAEGANMLQGITTTFFQEAEPDYTITSDHLVIEIDELTMVPAFKQVKPKSLIITNLFDDQIDRSGGKLNLAQTLLENLPQDITLYLNGDDPVLVWLGQQLKPQKIIYFGLDAKDIDQESKYPDEPCPVCGQPLDYLSRIYDSLGKFSCTCGFHSPEITYLAKNIDLDRHIFFLNNREFQMAYPQLYLIYNMLAVIAYGSENGLDLGKMSESLSERLDLAGRFEYLNFNQNKAWLNLVKNPAGLNQSINFLAKEMAKGEAETINIFIAFNNKPADGIDFTWLRQESFSLLQNPAVRKIYLAGDLKIELAKYFSEFDFDPERITIVEDLNQTIKAEKMKPFKNYFLTNFTMLNEVRQAIL